MSTDCLMDTAEDTKCRSSDDTISNTTLHADYHRSICLLLNSTPEPPAASSCCSRTSNLSDDEVSSYEQYEAGMPSGATFRSADELPIFRIQSLSPTSRSLSPIEFNDDDDGLLAFSLSPCGSTSDLEEAATTSRTSQLHAFDISDAADADRISIASINALIGTPPTSGPLGKRLNLETIFEGVFLHTPPQKGARIKEFVEDQRKQCRQRRLELPELDDYCDDVSPPSEPVEASESMMLLSIRN